MYINVINYGSFNIDKINIRIYDNNHNLLINDYIKKYIYYDLCNGIYYIELYICNNLFSSYVIINSCDRVNYIYLSCNIDTIKTFILYDYFYKGLKIQRGEIIIGT